MRFICFFLAQFSFKLFFGGNLLQKMVLRKHFRVVGSAPNFEIQPILEAEWLTCVNASIARVDRPPQLWVITDQVFDTSKNANKETLTLMRGRSCKSLIVIRRKYSKEEVIKKLSNLEVDFEELKYVGNFGRAMICQYYCGFSCLMKWRRPSNGVFSLILCMIALKSAKHENSKLVVEGIDPSSVEHFYRSGWRERGHRDADHLAFEQLRKEPELRFMK